MRKTVAALLLASASLVSVHAHAAAIVGLANTGTSGAGGVDVNWTLNGGLAYVSTAGVYPVGSAWLNNDATSSWITPTANQGDTFDPAAPGNYLYSLTFDLTGFDASTASFAGRLLVDNKVTSIVLNGNTIFSGNAGGFTGSDWFNFAANSGFVNGANVLQVNALNFAQSGGNPSGLRVEFTDSSVAAVPEPSVWALMIAGFAMTGFAMRRRRKPQVRTSVSYA
jgi:hypothetical protein